MDTIINSNVLHNKGETNQFAYYLGNDYGFLSFGKSEIDTPMQWTKIVNKSNYWTVQLVNVIK